MIRFPAGTAMTSYMVVRATTVCREAKTTTLSSGATTPTFFMETAETIACTVGKAIVTA